MPSGTVLNSVEDFIAVALKIFETAQHEVVFLVPSSLVSLAGTYDTIGRATRFIEQGGVVRGIMPISRDNIEEMQMRLDIGEDLRHSDEVHELLMFVGDKRESVSSINIGVEEFTLDTSVTAFWSESPIYAEYLLTSFEAAWSRAVPAEKRIAELL